MAASSNPFIFIGSRGHLDQDAKNTNELPKVSFANVLKIPGCYEEGSPAHILAFVQGPVATSSEGKTSPTISA